MGDKYSVTPYFGANYQSESKEDVVKDRTDALFQTAEENKENRKKDDEEEEMKFTVQIENNSPNPQQQDGDVTFKPYMIKKESGTKNEKDLENLSMDLNKADSIDSLHDTSDDLEMKQEK